MRLCLTSIRELTDEELRLASQQVCEVRLALGLALQQAEVLKEWVAEHQARAVELLKKIEARHNGAQGNTSEIQAEGFGGP